MTHKTLKDRHAQHAVRLGVSMAKYDTQAVDAVRNRDSFEARAHGGSGWVEHEYNGVTHVRMQDGTRAIVTRLATGDASHNYTPARNRNIVDRSAVTAAEFEDADASGWC